MRGLAFLILALLLAMFVPSGTEAKESPQVRAPATKAPPDEIFYEILDYESVVDGDTFKASGRTIRIWGINAPEKNQPLHDVTTLALAAFLDGKDLRCKFIEQDKHRW